MVGIRQVFIILVTTDGKNSHNNWKRHYCIEKQIKSRQHETSENRDMEMSIIKGWIKTYLKNINNEINRNKNGLKY